MRATTAISVLFALAASVSGWTLALHDTDAGSNPSNYYSLEGSATSEGSAGCITLPGSIPGDVSYCRFFTGGGSSSQACSAGTFTSPSSALLRDGGACTVYHGGQCSGAYSGWGAGSRSNVNNPSANWNSVKCWNT
ncbi:hypothetical protein M409DRAFT_19344 [Zasmidium cellare ATCC 36951]|uniref:Secreted LysM effector LysM C-terminal domain-containing protein n=1 Tax=Zasmidium cellare ATCC 36951 TaxID=1080233 RepID=A0A6A6CTP7_ZASCE|nr:uncharacterized protein M409DRAFT_19344 [Zasmidium cellare ATCC 36951]KAF2170524.1 hypothetical protein M409DRAFT_19344 [Zasmidium cellare ATCC 36951]